LSFPSGAHDELPEAVAVERRLRAHPHAAPVAEEELPRIAGVLALDRRDRLVDERQRHLGRDRLAARVERPHRERPLPAGQDLRPVGRHLDRQELLDGRDDDLLLVEQRVAVARRDRGEVHVRHVLGLHGEQDELRRALDVDDLVGVQDLALDAEEHPAVALRRADEHGRRLADLERVAVDDEVEAAGVVAELARAPRGDPRDGRGLDRAAAVVAAPPRRRVVALARRREEQARLALRVRRQRAGQHGLGLVPAELRLPALGRLAAREHRDHRGPRSADLLAGGIDPDLDPAVADDGDLARRGDGLAVRVGGLESEGDLVGRTVDVVLGVRDDSVREARDAHAALARDLAPRGVGDARLDDVLLVLAARARRREHDRRAPVAVGLHGLAEDDLPLAAPRLAHVVGRVSYSHG
jgi:hypothetical protein